MRSDTQPSAGRSRGAVLWDFLTTFVAARRMFLDVYALYDARVVRAARDRDVERATLQLPPRELFRLFHLERLEHLRDKRLAPLRLLARRIFGDDGDVGLIDAYCGHIFHEVSILSREHRSVGRFVRRHDPRRYRRLFDEVSGYYPERLRRVRRFFSLATRRLDELLPRWREERIIIRSTYLYGDALARRAWGRGREALYERMYLSGGVIRGYIEAARSFQESGFFDLAAEALGAGLSAAGRLRARRPLMADEREALADGRALETALRTRGAVPAEGVSEADDSPASVR